MSSIFLPFAAQIRHSSSLFDSSTGSGVSLKLMPAAESSSQPMVVTTIFRVFLLSPMVLRMIAREGNQRTDALAVSNGDRQPVAAQIVISCIVKKCLSGRIILGQFIPVEGQNRLASPSNDRIDSDVLFLEIARLPRDRVRANRTRRNLLTFRRPQRSIRECSTPMLAAIAFSVCSRSGPSSPSIVSVNRIAAASMVILYISASL